MPGFATKISKIPVSGGRIMRRKIILDECRWLLEAVTEEFDSIAGHADRIPAIETDILMENLRKLYQNLRILRQMDEPHPTDESIPVAPPASVNGVSTPPILPDPLQHSAPLSPANPVQPGKPAPPAQVKRPAKNPEIDLFAQHDPLDAMKLQDARERAFSPKIPGPGAENLKMAIPINDKFMFINDLFDGNLREYNETIEALNGFKTLDQAAEYLDLMRRKNLWNTSSAAFLKLKDLVERRF